MKDPIFLRENHTGMTSGLNGVPARLCEVSMIGISNNRSVRCIDNLSGIKLGQGFRKTLKRRVELWERKELQQVY